MSKKTPGDYLRRLLVAMRDREVQEANVCLTALRVIVAEQNWPEWDELRGLTELPPVEEWTKASKKPGWPFKPVEIPPGTNIIRDRRQ